MKIIFWAIGKRHESFVKEGVKIFTDRISHYYPVEWKIFPPTKNASTLANDELKKIESAAILNAVKKDDVLIALEESGRQWNSTELASFIQQKANESTKNLIFLIGGAYGLHENILNKCSCHWSLSKLVFPHQLVRLILAEQVYRACTIIRNEKYHHS